MQASPAQPIRRRRRFVRFVFYSLLGILLLITALLFSLSLPGVQQQLTDRAEAFLQKKMHTRVEVGAVRIAFPYYVSLEHFLLQEPSGDTLARIGKLKVDINMWKLLRKTVEFEEIRLKDASVNLVRRDSAFNFQFVLDAFAKHGEPDKPAADTGAAAWTLRFDLAKIDLQHLGANLHLGASLTRQEVDAYLPDSTIGRTLRLPARVTLQAEVHGTRQDLRTNAQVQLGKSGRLEVDGRLWNDSLYSAVVTLQNLLVEQLVTDSGLMAIKCVGLHLRVDGAGFAVMNAAKVRAEGRIDVFPDYDLAERIDSSLHLQAKDTLGSKCLHYLYRNLLVKPQVLADQIFLGCNDLYSNRAYQATLYRLLNLNLYKFINIRFEPRTDSLLDARIQLTPFAPQRLEGRLSGIFSPNLYYGLQAGATYTHRNLFKGAEDLRIGLNGAYLRTNEESLQYEYLVVSDATSTLTLPRWLFFRERKNWTDESMITAALFYRISSTFPSTSGGASGANRMPVHTLSFSNTAEAFHQ